jgi:hypothetical protein
MNRLLRFLLLFMLAHSSVFARESDSKKTSYRKQVKIFMKEEIKKLKNGVLLVRLQTKENTIAGLKQRGREDLASEIEQAQINYNKEIIGALNVISNFVRHTFFSATILTTSFQNS